MLLEITNLYKEYTRGKEPFAAVENVNLSVDIGQYVSIFGHSGSGKSTLLNMIAGLLKPTKGKILLNGKDIFNNNGKELSVLRSKKIGYILQGQNILTNFSVLDNICLPFYLFSKKGGIREKALELLEEVGLKEVSEEYPSKLSGGELRRVAIARSLINSPQIVIADEPTSNLDHQNAENIMELFQRISNKGTAVLVCTHDLKFLNYAERTYEMQRGRLRIYSEA